MKWLILSLFIATRIFIWTNPPIEFSQITYVYMPYAHLWASGEIPYLKQWYEYPPLTIPFFYLPHLIDMSTNNHWYHINYGNAYRGMMLLTDAFIFTLVWITLHKLRIRPAISYLSLSYYSLVTAKTNHFIYDSFDPLFMAAIVFSLAAPFLWKKWGNFVGWINFFTAAGIKLINAPLGLPTLVSQRRSWKRAIIEIIVAGIIVWSLPVVIFRSSLLVTTEYHKQRGLQVESFPATIVRTINQWTNTESYAEIAKAYDIQGPVSKQVEKIFDLIFPVSMMAYVLGTTLYVFRQKHEDAKSELIWITLGFISLFMMTSPVLSTPYLLWHIPLVAMLPTNNLKTKLGMFLTSFIIVAAGMTKIPNLPIGMLSAHILIGWIKTIGFCIILFQVLYHFKSSIYGSKA